MRECLREEKSKPVEVWIAEGRVGERRDEILHLAKEKRIPVLVKTTPDLDRLLPGLVHQGIVALTVSFHYDDLTDIVERSLKAPDYGLILAADHITDEGNLGALIRTAAFFDAHGLILPKDRSAGVSGRVQKRSSGTHLHLPIAQVVNLPRALESLHKQGFWIIGTASGAAESIYRCDWRRDLVLVLGSENKGLSRLVREKCHQMAGIPGSQKIDSLNVSVAAGVILSEIRRQREKK